MKVSWHKAVVGLALVGALAVGAVRMVTPAHAAPANRAQHDPHLAYANVTCRSVAQEKAFMRSAGASEMADHLKSVTCAKPTDPKPTKIWSQQSATTTWGGYVSDTLGQTNVNAAFAHYTLSSSSDNTYATAEWVGDGGWNTGSGLGPLLQGGVDLSDNEMWWEAINANDTRWGGSYDTSFTGTVGDLFDTEVIRTGVGVWDVTTEDITRGVAYDSGNQAFSPDHTTADWVMEYQGQICCSLAIPSLNASVPFADVWFDDINYNQHNVAYASTYYKSELGYVGGSGNCIKAGTLTNDTSTYSHFTDSWASSGC